MSLVRTWWFDVPLWNIFLRSFHFLLVLIPSLPPDEFTSGFLQAVDIVGTQPNDPLPNLSRYSTSISK